MPFEIVRNDIINMEVDVIVNTANPYPAIGSGVDSAIHKKAGPRLLEARKLIGNIDFGKVAITPAFDLNSKYVIHTISPIWIDGTHKEENILSDCYRNSLNLAKEYKCESIAFPFLATGNYRFPKSLALQIVMKEISSFLMENEMKIYLVVFDKESFELSEKLFKSVNSYIDEYYIHGKISDEYGYEKLSRRQLRARRDRANTKCDELESDVFGGYFPSSQSITLEENNLKEYDWQEILNELDAGFSETLLKLIDKTGKKDSEIYKKANVDRKLFSKIRNNIDYKPSKTTAIAFAFALELDLEQTKDFIARAGFALSHSNKFDVIVEYFLVNKNYNIFELNEVLFAFDQPLVGS